MLVHSNAYEKQYAYNNTELESVSGGPLFGIQLFSVCICHL